MSFATTATFTTATQRGRKPIPNLRYLCLLDQGPAEGQFTLNVSDPQQKHDVETTILRCEAVEVELEIKRYLGTLTGHAAQLSPIQPQDEWQKLLSVKTS